MTSGFSYRKEGLPRLMLIADGFTRSQISLNVQRAVQAGVFWIQLRDHDASTDAFDLAAEKLLGDVQRINNQVLISINSRLFVSQFHRLPFHTGRRGPDLSEARHVLGPDELIGASIHSPEEAVEARQLGATYAIFGPVWATSSHPERQGSGLEALASACRSAHPMPVVAIGGITPERVGSCLQRGAYGVAVRSGILESPSIQETVMNYRKQLNA